MIIDPVSASLGILSGGLGIVQGIASNRAAEQDRLNQSALQSAQSRFAQWQAGLNARTADIQGQYSYWQQQVSYGQNLAYTNSMRNFELVKAVNQAEVVRQTRVSAGSAYASSSQAISQMQSEAEMQDAVALKSYQWRAMQGRASVQAMNVEGNSVDRLINSYAQAEGDYATLMEINGKLRTRQYTRQQQGVLANYLSQYNSQTYYQEQPYFDPLPPTPPLPTMVMPSGPSMTGGSYNSTAAALNIGTGVLQGVSTYFDSARAVQQLKAGGKG